MASASGGTHRENFTAWLEIGSAPRRAAATRFAESASRAGCLVQELAEHLFHFEVVSGLDR